jgi:hypothetical protein
MQIPLFTGASGVLVRRTTEESTATTHSTGCPSSRT